MPGLGSGLRRLGFREGDNGGTNGRLHQPPAIVQEPPWQPRAPESKGDDFAHGPTMPGRLAADLSGMFRICGFLCRYRADAKSYLSPGDTSLGQQARRLHLEGPLVLAVLPLIAGLLVFLGGHETKAEFATVAREARTSGRPGVHRPEV